MKKLFVVTTIELPLNQGEIIQSEDVEKIITESIMELEEGIENDITDYLNGYQHTQLNAEVKEYLSKQTHLPIVKRVVGDYYFYITMCISSNLAPKGGKSGHNYIAQLVEVAKKNMGFEKENDNLYVLAHDKDLYKESQLPCENNRFLNHQELKGKLAELGLGDNQVYIYQHKNDLEIYETLIRYLSANNEELKEHCNELLEFLEED